MTTKRSAQRLRGHLAALDTRLALLANVLWEKVRPIQERQSTTNGMKNGASHCLAVESNAWRLITDSGKTGDFNALELFILSCAAACHDLDKGLENSLPREFHGEMSGQFAVRLGEGGLLLEPPAASAINSIIRIHSRTDDYLEALNNIPRSFPIGTIKVDLRRLAVLLKAGDVLHADCSRLDVLSGWEGKLTGLALSAFLARKCTYGWHIDGSRVVFDVLPKNAEEKSAFEDGFAWTRTHEWKPISVELASRGFPHELEAEYFQGTEGEASAQSARRGASAEKVPGRGQPRARGKAGSPGNRKKRIGTLVESGLTYDELDSGVHAVSMPPVHLYVALLDVLAYREHLARDQQAGTLEFQNRLSAALSVFASVNDAVFRVQAISDTVIVTCLDHAHFPQFLRLLQIAFVAFLKQGLFVRGGIAYSRHFQSGYLTYSPAIARAHELEAELAVYPRVVIDNNIIAMYETGSGLPSIHSRGLLCMENGVYFLNVLSKGNWKTIYGYAKAIYQATADALPPDEYALTKHLRFERYLLNSPHAPHNATGYINKIGEA